MKHKLLPINFMSFVLGGKSLFTIKNKGNGNRFTYKVTIPADTTPETANIFFVKLLNGSDNENGYKYIGFIRKVNEGYKFTYGKSKSKITEDCPGVIAFYFVFNRLVVPGINHPDLEIWHEGKCCRCGRTLTVPESVETGIGPECLKRTSNKFQFTNEFA